MAMESAEMEEILKILIEDEELIKNWKGLADSLGLGIADCVSLKNLYKQSTTTATDFFSEILSRWRSVKGQGAIIAKLVETLEGLDFKEIAEKIEAALNIDNEAELPTNPIEHDVLKWNDSMEEIRGNGETGALSIELLNILSYFNPEGTDLEFLKTIHRGTISAEDQDQSEKNYEEALSLIKDHLLFKYENEVISIHCLVQEVIRRNCSCRNLEESLLRKLVQSVDTIMDELKKCDMANILSVWKYAFNYDEIVKEFSDFPNNVINRLEDLSLFREMLDFVNLSCRILSRILGDDDLETLEVESLAAKALSLNGKYDEALQKFTVVVERQKSVLGKEHPATLITETNMAGVLYLLDRFNEAQELCQRLLESDKKIFAENQEVTIVTKGHMANILSSLGKFTDAMEIYEEVLGWQKTELGEEDLETLTTRHNIGCCLFEQKKFTQAKGIFEEVLKSRLKMFGEEHSETLSTKYMFALTFDSLGESEKGLEMLKKVLLSRENVLGQEHPDTINTREEIDSISRRSISAQPATTTDPPVRVSERMQTTLDPANEAEDSQFPLNITGDEHGLTNHVTWNVTSSLPTVMMETDLTTTRSTKDPSSTAKPKPKIARYVRGQNNGYMCKLGCGEEIGDKDTDRAKLRFDTYHHQIRHCKKRLSVQVEISEPKRSKINVAKDPSSTAKPKRSEINVAKDPSSTAKPKRSDINVAKDPSSTAKPKPKIARYVRGQNNGYMCKLGCGEEIGDKDTDRAKLRFDTYHHQIRHCKKRLSVQVEISEPQLESRLD